MSKNERKTIGIGLLGLGTVGSGVVKILKSERSAIEKKTGLRLELRRVCVRSLTKKRPVHVPKNILTTRALSVVNDPSVDVLV